VILSLTAIFVVAIYGAVWVISSEIRDAKRDVLAALEKLSWEGRGEEE
jgi:hypothetical protein